MILNEEQEQIYDLIMKPPDNVRIFALYGNAGTGKSTVIAKIAKEYPGSILLTATTNKAKNLLKAATKLSAFTTHSALGFVMARNGIEEYLSDILEAKEADLLIVDEVSMLPNQVYQKIIQTPYKYILFVGDECQLPAIGIKAKIEADITVTLTKQMRQDKNKILENYFANLRANMSKKYIPKLQDNLPDCIKLYDNHKEFCQAYLSCSKSKRILAYSNRIIDSYNLNIKQGNKFSLGDLLVLDKPIGNVKNGDIATILDIKETDTKYILDLEANGELLCNLVCYKTKKSEEEFFTLLLKTNHSAFWAYKDQTIHPKHIFASTIHKAQGQTIDEVFIDVTDILSQLKRKPSKWNNYNKPISIEEYLKLLYVAISRMKSKAHLFIGENRDYKQLRKGND
ncbi:ATP-dependent DNA helicase [Campylobacter curvus]|uniref:ATP-dependent DNA helicase n=1 Tax=Campylobacter curvus TaxID=200 RepID=UPI00146FCC6E|nr:DEAD/DEAH box helicase [Campylobacter curvus]